MDVDVDPRLRISRDIATPLQGLLFSKHPSSRPSILSAGLSILKAFYSQGFLYLRRRTRTLTSIPEWTYAMVLPRTKRPAVRTKPSASYVCVCVRERVCVSACERERERVCV